MKPLPPLDAAPRDSSSRHFWLGAGLLVAQLVLAAAAAQFGFRTLGVALFVATPLSVGVAAGLVSTRQQLLKLLGVLVAVPLLLLVTIGVEGVLCVALAAPLLSVMLVAGYGLGQLYRWLFRRGREGYHAALWVPAATFLVSAGVEQFVGVGFVPNRAVTTAEVPFGKTEVFAAIVHVDTVTATPTWLHAIGLPRPISSHLDTLAVGARRTCTLSDGVIAERLTALDAPHAVAMDMGGADMGRPWLRLRRDAYTLDSLPDGGTRITHATDFVSNLRPRAYWTAVERYTVRAQHRLVFDNLLLDLAADAATATTTARE